MAMQSLRLRRTLASVSTLHRFISSPIPTISPPLLESLISTPQSVQSPTSLLFKARPFTGSPISLSSLNQNEGYDNETEDEDHGDEDKSEIAEETVAKSNDEGEIGDEKGSESKDDGEIAGETAANSNDEEVVNQEPVPGLDYNHWMIAFNLPDPKPGFEELVATYEQTCAKGLGISVEEAKKRIYACSTETYYGFHVEMSKEEAAKMKELGDHLFVIPDSYVDPQVEDYGGDKYENGVITFRNKDRNLVTTAEEEKWVMNLWAERVWVKSKVKILSMNRDNQLMMKSSHRWSKAVAQARITNSGRVIGEQRRLERYMNAF